MSPLAGRSVNQEVGYSLAFLSGVAEERVSSLVVSYRRVLDTCPNGSISFDLTAHFVLDRLL